MREFKNVVPIDDAIVALDLLKPWRGDGTTRELFRGRITKESGPYIEVGHHHDFSDSSWERYLVSKDVVLILIGAMHVQGKKHWGYTDDMVLSISESGLWFIWDKRKELKVPDRTLLYGWTSPPKDGSDA
jgi:hypothetical protein